MQRLMFRARSGRSFSRPDLKRARSRRPGSFARALGFVLAAGLSLGVGACGGSGDSMALQLVYAPTHDVDLAKTGGVPPVASGTQIWINPVTDARVDPGRIGISEEEDNTPIYYAAGQNPGDFVRNVLAKELTTLGLPITANQAAATHALNLQLQKFWVTEGNNYLGEVTVGAALVDINGQLLWQGQLTGAAKRWGRSFEEDNFLEAYSDMVLDLAERVAMDPTLRNALATNQPQPYVAQPVAPQPAAPQP